MINIKLSLGSPAELEAFGTFCTAVAAARRAEPPLQRAYGLLGINRDPGVWKNHAGEVGNLTASEQEMVKEYDERNAADGVDTPRTVEAATDAPKRERGQPSPGKARRTKAEIAEDEAADKADIERGARLAADYTAKTADFFQAEQPLISTDPENRVGPEDTPEDAAQDAADEAAETAAQRGDDPALTVEDLRNVLGLYVKAYGMANAQVDLPVVLQEVCGEGVVKATDVPEDKIADAIAAIKKTGKENRFGRELAPQVTE